MQQSLGHSENMQIIDTFQSQIQNYHEEQILNRFLNNFQKKNVSQTQSQTDQPLQRIIQQIRNISQQTDTLFQLQSHYQQIQPITNPQPIITHNPLQQTISQIKQHLPQNINFQQFIREAYHKYNNSLEQDELKLDYTLVNHQSFQQIDYNSSFHSNDQQLTKKLDQYRIIANYLSDQGIKQENLQSAVQINEAITLDVHQFLTKTAILFRTTFRKLQQTIYDIYNTIIRLGQQDLKVLYRLLFNHPKYLTLQQSNIWFSLIKKSCNLPSEVTETQTLNIYKILISLVKDHRQQQQSVYSTASTSTDSNKVIWNQEIDRDICRLYLIHKRYKASLSQLNRKYIQTKQSQLPIFTERLICNRLESIMTKTLQKLQKQYNKIDPDRKHICLLTDKEYRILLRSREALPTRLLLANLYLHSQITLQNIYQISKSIYDVFKNTLKPSQNSIAHSTRKNDIKTQMKANINNNINHRTQQQSERSQSTEEVKIQTRKKKSRYLIESDEEQLKQPRPRTSQRNERYYPQDPIIRQSARQRNKKQLTIMQAYDQKQQKYKNTNAIDFRTSDFSRKITPSNLLPRPTKQLDSGNNNLYAMMDRNIRTDLIVNDITRKIRMDLNVKRGR